MEHYFAKLERIIAKCWNEKALCNIKGECYTHKEIVERISRLHIIFSEAGIDPGDKIAICAKNSASWAISFLAANTYGAVTVPLLSDFKPDCIANLINHSESRILFTDPDIFVNLDTSSLNNIKAVVNCRDFTLLFCSDYATLKAFDNSDRSFKNKYPDGISIETARWALPEMDKVAIINYTSGTTGEPKGVMITYGSLSAVMEYASEKVPCSMGNTIVSMLPMGHIYGFSFEFIYPLCNGATIYFLGRTPSPTRLMEAMREVRPFLVCTVPLVMEKIYKTSIEPALSKPAAKILTIMPFTRKMVFNRIRSAVQDAFGGNVNEFIIGGAALNPEVEKCFKKIGLNYTVGYGMTEAAPLLAFSNWDEYAPGSCGKAVDCAEIKIDSPDPEHIPGEILAKGKNLFIGYYKNPEVTASVFTDEGFFRTGDLGIIDKDGNIFIKGRSKSMILSANGQNIYPEEIEAVVNSQEFVVESLLVEREKQLVSLVLFNKDELDRKNLTDKKALLEVIKEKVNKILPRYSQIAKMEEVDKPFEKTPKMSIKRRLYQ